MPPPTPGLINLDDTTPSAPAGAFANVKWQISNSFTEVVNFDGELITVQAANVSAYVSTSSGGGGSTAVGRHHSVSAILAWRFYCSPWPRRSPCICHCSNGIGRIHLGTVSPIRCDESVPNRLGGRDHRIRFRVAWAGKRRNSSCPFCPRKLHRSSWTISNARAFSYSDDIPGAIWFQQPTPWDATNLYLTAAAGGITGKAEVWAQIPSLAVSGKTTIPIAPSLPGLFSVAHGLGTAPELVLVRMKSAGAIWLQIPPWDATFVYLVASAPSLLADLDIWTGGTSAGSVPIIVVSAIAGSPSGSQLVMIFTAVSNMSFPGNFTGSYGSLGTNPTATATYTINLNGSAVGTISISTGGVFTFTSAGGAAVSMVAGDRLTLVAQTIPDATLADVGVSLVAARG